MQRRTLIAVQGVDVCPCFNERFHNCGRAEPGSKVQSSPLGGKLVLSLNLDIDRNLTFEAGVPVGELISKECERRYWLSSALLLITCSSCSFTSNLWMSSVLDQVLPLWLKSGCGAERSSSSTRTILRFREGDVSGQGHWSKLSFSLTASQTLFG